MRLTSFLLFVAVGVSLGGVGSAHAQDFGTRAALDYQAAEGCPDEGAFTDQVAARLGIIPFREDASQTVRVRLVADGDSWMGTAEVGEASPRLMRGPRCEDVARDLAAAVAVILVPEPPEPEPEPEPEPQGGVVGGTAPPAPPAPSGPPGTVPVRFTTATDDERTESTVHVRVGSVSGHGVRRPVCTTPCEAPLAPERYQLALSHETEAPRDLPELTTIDGPSHVHIQTESYAGTRMVGTVLSIVGVVGLAAALGLTLSETLDVEASTVVGGAALGFVVTGALLGITSDEHETTVTPL